MAANTQMVRALSLLAILAGSGSVLQAADPAAVEIATVRAAIDNATKICAQAADLCTLVPPTTINVALACRPAVKLNRILYCGQHLSECVTEDLTRIENGLPIEGGSLEIELRDSTTLAQGLTRLRGMAAVCQMAVDTAMGMKTAAATAAAAATELAAETKASAELEGEKPAEALKPEAAEGKTHPTDLGDEGLGVEDGGVVGGVVGGLLGDQPLYAGIGGVTNPELIPSSKTQSKYPEIARKAKIQGKVILQAIVKKDGTVGDIQVLQSPGTKFGFDEAAVAAVKQWRYKPALQNGKPVDVYFTVVVPFVLPEKL